MCEPGARELRGTYAPGIIPGTYHEMNTRSRIATQAVPPQRTEQAIISTSSAWHVVHCRGIEPPNATDCNTKQQVCA